MQHLREYSLARAPHRARLPGLLLDEVPLVATEEGPHRESGGRQVAEVQTPQPLEAATQQCRAARVGLCGGGSGGPSALAGYQRVGDMSKDLYDKLAVRRKLTFDGLAMMSPFRGAFNRDCEREL